MAHSQVFREVFHHPTGTKQFLHWFPGHMAKGLRVMQNKLRSVDGIIEVHDARIPFSGRNVQLQDKLAMVRPHLFILNKTDLADLSRKDEIIAKLKTQGVTDVMLTDLKQMHGAREIVPKIMEMIQSVPRYVQGGSAPVGQSTSTTYHLMVIGVPNVGKSTLINVLRNIHMKKGGKPAPVGNMPGITRAVQTGIHVSHRPNIYVLDTPGVSAPNVRDENAGMRLALCHVLQDSRIGEDLLVDYLLFWLNKHRDFRYVDFFELEKATDSVTELLVQIAVKQNIFHTVRPVEGGPSKRRVDIIGTARWVLAQFRAGKLGEIMLDTDYLSPSWDESIPDRRMARS